MNLSEIEKNVPDWLSAAITAVVGTRFIGRARASLNFGSINAGLQEILTVTVTGALLEDFVDVGFAAAPEAGLEITARVSAADTVAVTCVNNTAGAIDPAAITTQATVRRASR